MARAEKQADRRARKAAPKPEAEPIELIVPEPSRFERVITGAMNRIIAGWKARGIEKTKRQIKAHEKHLRHAYRLSLRPPRTTKPRLPRSKRHRLRQIAKQSRALNRKR